MSENITTAEKPAQEKPSKHSKRYDAKKHAEAHADELRRVIDAVAAIVADSATRGFMPTFSVRGGALGMVAIYEIRNDGDAPKRGRGRPPRAVCPIIEGVEGAGNADEIDIEVS